MYMKTMKIVRLLCAAAAVAVLSAACGKADDAAVQGAAPAVAPAVPPAVTAGFNELVLDGTVYPLLTTATKAPNGRYIVSSRCPEGEVLYLFSIEIMETALGRTSDLAVASPSDGYDFSLSGERVPNFSLNNIGGYFYGSLGQETYDGSSIFVSGTLRVAEDREELVCSLDGVTVGGTTVSLDARLPVADVDVTGYCGR